MLESVLADLAAEGDQLEEAIADLPATEWSTITTPEGWTVSHTIGHLHWTDSASIAAASDPEAFSRIVRSAAASPASYVDEVAAALARVPPAELLARWNSGRAELDRTLRRVRDTRIRWFGPPMSPTSMATARLMETWAHGYDILTALGAEVPRTSRVRHVCHIGVRARAFAYAVRGQAVPEAAVRVELTSPGGELWTWGPAEAAQRVHGPAWDFALLATRRRHLDDVELRAEGDDAAHWLTIVQAFAGAPGNDPLPLARGLQSE